VAASGTAPVTAIDTNVVVASLLSWHEFHDRAKAALAASRARGERLILPLPVMIQAFSVMTRLPPPHGLPSRPARDAMRASFHDVAEVAAPDADSGWRLVDDAIALRVQGGGLYDFQILECAARAGAEHFVTFDPEDFRRFGDRGVEIVAA
jgi:predicted nucleic acid-binding protein